MRKKWADLEVKLRMRALHLPQLPEDKINFFERFNCVWSRASFENSILEGRVASTFEFLWFLLLPHIDVRRNTELRRDGDLRMQNDPLWTGCASGGPVSPTPQYITLLFNNVYKACSCFATLRYRRLSLVRTLAPYQSHAAAVKKTTVIVTYRLIKSVCDWLIVLNYSLVRNSERKIRLRRR
jgi:hypothetical protein